MSQTKQGYDTDSSDDTVDEMRYGDNADIEIEIEVTENMFSLEGAMENLLPVIKMSRDKRIEVKKDMAGWEYQRALAVYRYLQLLLSDIGKMEASAEAATLYYQKSGSECYKARSIRWWTQHYYLRTGTFLDYKQASAR